MTLRVFIGCLVFGLFAAGSLLGQPGEASRPAVTKPVVVTAGKAEGTPGSDVTIPISLKGVKEAKGTRGLQMRITYDPAVLTYKSLDRGPALAQSMLGESSDPKADPGKVAVGFICTFKSPTSKEFAIVEDDGIVLNVVFTINGEATAGQKSALAIDNYRLIDSGSPPFELPVSAEPGEIVVQPSGFKLPFPWWWLLIPAGFLLLLLLWFAMRRRPEPQSPQRGWAAQPELVALPLDGPGQHTCVKCGRLITVPPEMLGKMFRCPACGTAQAAR